MKTIQSNGLGQIVPEINRNKSRAFTLVEMIVVIVIITTLAMLSIPMFETAVKRDREIELRRSLRIIRQAIDDYKAFMDENSIEYDKETYGYPRRLDDLVDGIEYQDKENKTRIQKFLRKIPVDPVIPASEWGLRSYQQKRDSLHWGGENVWDVYSKSVGQALDESFYKDW
jgi:general secretion pathway protein G